MIHDRSYSDHLAYHYAISLVSLLSISFVCMIDNRPGCNGMFMELMASLVHVLNAYQCHMEVFLSSK